MRKVHCAGCGAAEPEDVKRILPAKFVIPSDHPSRSWEKEETYEEDLCPDCVKAILKRFFGVKDNTRALDPPIMFAVGE